eukprot:54828-Eustigmatos_ZCMA.PRE.1
MRSTLALLHQGRMRFLGREASHSHQTCSGYDSASAQDDAMASQSWPPKEGNTAHWAEIA